MGKALKVILIAYDTFTCVIIPVPQKFNITRNSRTVFVVNVLRTKIGVKIDTLKPALWESVPWSIGVDFCPW